MALQTSQLEASLMGVVVLGMFFLCFLCCPPPCWTLVAHQPFCFVFLLSLEEEVVEASSRDTQAL